MDYEGFLKLDVRFSTLAVHAGQNPSKFNTAMVSPIVTATTFKQPAPAQPVNYEYGRIDNPSRNTLEELLAALDGGKHGLAFSSGLGATSSVVSLLSKGDHVISSDDIFGGTNKYFRSVASRMGIETTFIDVNDNELLRKSLRDNTKMLWIETPSNPLMKVVDLELATRTAKEHGDVIVVVDNTFLTPYLQRPLNFGVDIVLYSLTKYMNGHTDVVMGAAVLKDDDLKARLKLLQIVAGAIPSPFDCYMVTRGLKTLPLRMKQHGKSSKMIAQWLEKHPRVKEVLHPGLPSHPNYELSKRQTCGHSGMFSFKHKGGFEESSKFLSALKLFSCAPSLGGCESLANIPMLMTHGNIPKEQRLELGITENLLRVSIGIEDPEDLIEDLEQALEFAFK